jgi:hypothetical protein
MAEPLGGLLGMHLKLKCMIRTQDPHHPYVFGARVVIAHPNRHTQSIIKTLGKRVKKGFRRI